MFDKNKNELEKLGATITTQEIYQQPELWEETLQNYINQKEQIDTYLNYIQEKHEHVRVILSGAGTSAFVGETVEAYLNEKNERSKWLFEEIPTTSIVAAPNTYLDYDIPTILVSFARSGNSPESIATVELANKMIKDIYHITITCAEDGTLASRARDEENNLLLLQPKKSNDQGFAMTGSYTCMTLTSLLIFDTSSLEEKAQFVLNIKKMAEYLLNNEHKIQDIIDLQCDRVIYLGANALLGVAHEAQLKILELTAGKITTMYETPVGFRHGPKSFVNNDSVVVVFGSNDSYTRKYDEDLVNEVYQDKIAKKVILISAIQENNVSADTFTFAADYQGIPDAYLALPYIIFGQMLGLMAAISVGNLPDTPSPTGTVNRVVQGVVIHDISSDS